MSTWISTDPQAAGRRSTQMITRRAMLCSSGIVIASSAVVPMPSFAALPVPPSNTLAFEILRKGSRIGTHTLKFARSGDALTVDIAVDMAVYFGPIRVFHYSHRNIERWKADRFVSMDAKTDYDGEPSWCTIRREGGGIAVEGSKAARYAAPANALPATHWNKAELQGPMINPENGMLLKPTITDLGPCSLTLASGSAESAHHFTWRGEDALDLWYDAQNDWAALTAVTKSGETLTYRRV